MPRQMRVEYPGAMYHVMSRGDQRDDIFLDDVDRHEFIKTLAEACQQTDWWVQAFCLMKNHYHIVIETPNGNLVAGMQWLQSTGIQQDTPGEDLIRRPKSDPMKLALAARLRRETTLSIKQIAGRLNLGKPKGAKSNPHKWMNGPPDDGSQPKLDIG